MRIAFYAPLKSPNSNVPSGDRRVARSLIQAFELRGHDVEIASEFQTREPKGQPEVQEKLKAEGQEIAEALVASYRARPESQRPQIWFTYHLYYKAMDWIGPHVSEELAIPYAAAEVSNAPKRAGGPWDMSHHALGEIIKKSAAIISLNSLDSACVLPDMSDPSGLVTLKPFMEMSPLLDNIEARSTLGARFSIDPSLPVMVTVAMMRDDAKLRSYEVLGQALSQLKDLDWQLLVIGDGPARGQVETLLGHEHVCYLGELPEGEINAVLAGSDLFVWPAVNEAYGMAMLEAQAVGLPVVAGRTGGVADIIRDQETGLLCEVGNAADFADKLRTLLANRELLETMSENAINLIRPAHSIEAAADILDQTLRRLIK